MCEAPKRRERMLSFKVGKEEIVVPVKENLVGAPAHLSISTNDFSGFLCIRGEKLEFIPADEKQFKDIISAINLYKKQIKDLAKFMREL